MMEQVKFEDGQSLDVVSENIEKLKELFPDAFSEGGVNFDTLRQLLGDAAVLDEGEEKYGLNWHGKKKARQIALTPSTGTLLPCPEESVDWDTTQNLFIEGDNLEVLKLLQKSYANKVKMIYIDPPYNSGNDFIYPDNYADNLDTYLRYSGQKGDDGLVMTSSAESSGRFHSTWMNMMYPRLKLAKQLMTNDGLIFISIDSRESSNLRLICNEIFGEENFFEEIVWKNKTGGGAKTKGWIGLHEYILVYAKNLMEIGDISIPYSEKTASMYNKKDEHYDLRGPYATWPLDTTSMGDRPNLKFPIFHKGEEIWPKKQWLWSKERVEQAQSQNMLVFNKQENGDWKVRFKGYLKDENGVVRRGKPLTILDGPYTQEGSKDFQKYMPKAVFPFPKPVRLIKDLIGISTTEVDVKDGIVLDFFAGSGTTAQAVNEYNKENDASLRYICVQMPEPLYQEDKAQSAAYKYCEENNLSKVISSITKQRIKLSSRVEESIDKGFKNFKLSNSNIRTWNPDRTDLEDSLLSHEEHLVEGRSEQDILYELLIKRGVDLAVPIESREVDGKNIYSIGYGVLFACLDEDISREQVEGIAQGILDWHKELSPSSDTHVFFRDSAFRDDVSKTNMAAILEQNGISHVRSL